MESQLNELNQKLKTTEMDKETLKLQKDELTKEKNEVRKSNVYNNKRHNNYLSFRTLILIFILCCIIFRKRMYHQSFSFCRILSISVFE